jgi:acetyl-CoA C-acetyltransferase
MDETETMSRPVFIIAARRTPIAPKNGDLKTQSFFELATHALRSVMFDLSPHQGVHSVIAGNALGAGGNPARLMALAAGLPEATPALTVDTQCCSGLDAIGLGFERLKARAQIAHAQPGFSRARQVMLAGGAESASQAPIRQDRLTQLPYEEAPFTPWPGRNPTMIQAARHLETLRAIDQPKAWDWAVRSHQLNLEKQSKSRSLTPMEGGLQFDNFPRKLTRQVCERSERVGPYNPTLMAPLADGAAFVAISSSAETTQSFAPLEILDYRQTAADPGCPGLACASLELWLEYCEQRYRFKRSQVIVALMESFAAQVLANIQDLRLNADLVNPWGGMLARGHPIGASGAVLVCDLFDYLKPGQIGLALIPAAGGLASGLLVRRPAS